MSHTYSAIPAGTAVCSKAWSLVHLGNQTHSNSARTTTEISPLEVAGDALELQPEEGAAGVLCNSIQVV